MIPILRTVADLRARVRGWKREGATLGVVPTMGALHDGHLSLVRAAQRDCDRVVVTICAPKPQMPPCWHRWAWMRFSRRMRISSIRTALRALFG